MQVRVCWDLFVVDIYLSQKAKQEIQADTNSWLDLPMALVKGGKGEKNKFLREVLHYRSKFNTK